MSEEYKFQLGVDLKVNDIRDRITQYNQNKNNAKLKLGIKLDTDDLKRQINQLNLGGTGGNKGVAIPINTTSLEGSLREVKGIIEDIKKSLGTFDKKGMQSLLSSVNQIATALGKATDESETLVKSLNALSKRDFSFNIGLSTGGSNPIGRNAAYGNKVRNETLPQLKQQMNELVKYYNNIYKSSFNEFEVLQKLVSGTKLSSGDFFETFLFGKDSVASRMSGGSLASQMQAYKQYIDMFKQLAGLKGLDLTPVTSGFSKTSEELVKDAQDIQTGANEVQDSFEKLQQIIGGGIDTDSLSDALKPISDNLNEIKKAFESLSSIGTVDGLITSFKELSEVLEKLTSNITIAKNALDNGLNTTVSDNGTEKAVQDQKELAQTSTQTANVVAQNEERKQQAYRATSNETQRFSDEAEALKKDLNFNDASIDSMKQSFQELGIAIDSVAVNLKNGALDSFTIKGTDGIERTVTATQRLDDNITKIVQSFAKAQNQADKIEFKIDTGKFASQMTTVEDKFSRLSVKSEDIEADIKSLKSLFSNMQTAAAAGDIEKLINSYKEYEIILESVNNKLDINNTKQQAANRQQRRDNSDAALTEAKKALSWEIDTYLKNNTAAAKQFGDTIRKIRAEIDACDDSPALRNLKSQFQNVKAEANATLNSTQSFGDKLKKQWSQYSSYLSVASIFMYAEQGLRSMFEQVKLIDSAMTELKKVTNETDASYNKFLSNAADRAKAIGTTIDGLVSSTADFARLGYGFEDAQGLAEVANIYAVVGDEIEGVEGATESLISTMAAFKDEMNGMSNTDFAMSIVDKFNEIGNNFSISSGGIGEALERSASSLMAANNTIDESIALITAANTVVVLCHAA